MCTWRIDAPLLDANVCLIRGGIDVVYVPWDCRGIDHDELAGEQ